MNHISKLILLTTTDYFCINHW